LCFIAWQVHLPKQKNTKDIISEANKGLDLDIPTRNSGKANDDAEFPFSKF